MCASPIGGFIANVVPPTHSHAVPAGYHEGEASGSRARTRERASLSSRGLATVAGLAARSTASAAWVDKPIGVGNLIVTRWEHKQSRAPHDHWQPGYPERKAPTMAMLTADTLEICDRPPLRGTLVIATANAGSPVGRYVGRTGASIDWVSWPEQGEAHPSREAYEALCATFDAAAVKR